jgi:hypothetical protein
MIHSTSPNIGSQTLVELPQIISLRLKRVIAHDLQDLPNQGGRDGPSLSSSEGLNPNISPTKPPGFGTGHSLFDLLIRIRAPSSSQPFLFSSGPSTRLSLVSSVFSPSHFRRLLLLGAPLDISPSAYATLGAGHGRICGNATTKKLAKSVVAKREDVSRLRGCRWGGMMGMKKILGSGRRGQLELFLVSIYMQN